MARKTKKPASVIVVDPKPVPARSGKSPMLNPFAVLGKPAVDPKGAVLAFNPLDVPTAGRDKHWEESARSIAEGVMMKLNADALADPVVKPKRKKKP